MKTQLLRVKTTVSVSSNQLQQKLHLVVLLYILLHINIMIFDFKMLHQQ